MLKKIVCASCFVIFTIASSASCTPAAGPIVVSQLPADVIADVGCVVADMTSGSQASIAQIVAQCASNLLPAQAAALLQALLQGGGIAMKTSSASGAVVVVHIPAIVMTDALKTRLTGLQGTVSQ